MASRMEILISARDQATKTLKGITKTLRKLGKVAKKSGGVMGRVFAKVKNSVFSLKTALVSLAGIGGFIGLTKSILKTGGAFEDYKSTLKVVLGSQKKANKAFAWVKKFAEETPFSVDNLTASFVKLSAYGIDGTKVMRTLGDTAAGMGKDINMAVEALADAQTGEFERLKEFGIKALQLTKSNAVAMGATMKDVGKTALTFTDKMGKQAFKIVDRNNRAMITSTLMAIWNERYAGAMKERSKTMNGLLSNLGDAWVNFKALVADKIMPAIKEKLQGVLDKIKEWGEDGTIEGWANGIATAIDSVIAAMAGFLSAFEADFLAIGLGFENFDTSIKGSEEKGRAWGESFRSILLSIGVAFGLLDEKSSIALGNTHKNADNVFRGIQATVEGVIGAFNWLYDVTQSVGDLFKTQAAQIPATIGLIKDAVSGLFSLLSSLWGLMKKISGWKAPKPPPIPKGVEGGASGSSSGKSLLSDKQIEKQNSDVRRRQLKGSQGRVDWGNNGQWTTNNYNNYSVNPISNKRKAVNANGLTPQNNTTGARP